MVTSKHVCDHYRSACVGGAAMCLPLPPMSIAVNFHADPPLKETSLVCLGFCVGVLSSHFTCVFYFLCVQHDQAAGSWLLVCATPTVDTFCGRSNTLTLSAQVALMRMLQCVCVCHHRSACVGGGGECVLSWQLAALRVFRHL